MVYPQTCAFVKHVLITFVADVWKKMKEHDEYIAGLGGEPGEARRCYVAAVVNNRNFMLALF